jgi:hypothetical protein
MIAFRIPGGEEKKLLKGTWRMPGLRKAKKDVISCDKLRGSANTNRSADFRMGQPGMRRSYHPFLRNGGERGELKHLSTCRKRKQTSDSPSSGERKGSSPNRWCFGIIGVVGLYRQGIITTKWNILESLITEGDNPVHESSFFTGKVS